LSAFSFAYCNVPVAPLRKEASHQSEQISQILFGEKLHILSPVQEGWVFISGQLDDYCGWIKVSQIQPIDKKQYIKAVKYLSATHQGVLIHENGPIAIPLGSSLTGMKKNTLELTPGEAVKFKGRKVILKFSGGGEERCRHTALQFVGAPYLWGGRTHMGIDCSGLSQMVFKMMNIALRRDAWMQAEQGEMIDFLQNARCGDLAFFDNAEGRIVHVGILLDSHTIIHATEKSGCVVIDKIDSNGIISTRHRTRTHNLRLIRRYF